MNAHFKCVCFVRLPGSLLYRVTDIPNTPDVMLQVKTKYELTRFCIHAHNGIWYFRLRSNEETDVVGDALRNEGIEVIFIEPDNTSLN